MDEATPVLGWKEQVSLPEWGISRLRAKLDTGARTSALHVGSLERIGEHTLDGRTLPILRFGVLVGSRDDPRTVEVEAPAIDVRLVRDTGAREEQRPVVRTRILCGPLDLEADVTLTDRTGMNFRLLLGRVALAGRCLVDPGRGYLESPTPPTRHERDARRQP